MKPIGMAHSPYLEILLAKFGFAVIICPVSVTKAKSDDFDI